MSTSKYLGVGEIITGGDEGIKRERERSGCYRDFHGLRWTEYPDVGRVTGYTLKNVPREVKVYRGVAEGSMSAERMRQIDDFETQLTEEEYMARIVTKRSW